MPDLKSELEKALRAWETDAQPATEPQPHQENLVETTLDCSLTEQLFNYVRAHPGHTAIELEDKITGLANSSISPMLSAMVKRGVMRKVGGRGASQRGCRFVVVADKYLTPAEQLGLERNHRVPLSALAATKVRAPVQAPLPAVVEAVPAAHATPPAKVSVHDIDVESLTVAEARVLRDKLNALFA